MLPEISDEKRAWYILQGYEITTTDYYRSWVLNGFWHREDGPAIEYADGKQFWYLNGKHMSEKEHRIAVQKLREEQNAT